MKKLFVIYILFYSISLFSQKNKLIEYGVEIKTDYFNTHNKGQVLNIEQNVSASVLKKLNFSSPMITSSLFIEKRISKRIMIGSVLGFSYIQNNENEVRYKNANKNIYAFPIHLQSSYYFESKKNAIQPFINIQLGYIFTKSEFKIGSIYKETMLGGFDYESQLGIKFNKKSKLLKDVRVLVGYHNFYTHINAVDYLINPTGVKLSYNIRRESYSFSIEYVFPHKKQDKKR